MKKVAMLLISTLLLTGCVAKASDNIQMGKLVDCASVNHDPSITTGAYVQCLANTDLAIFESLRGPAIINFFGSWCPPCRQEMPYFRNLYAKPHHVDLIGIDVEEKNIEDGRSFVKSFGITWPVFYDYSGSTRKFTGPGVPVTLFIDAQGKTIYTKMGAFTNEKELLDAVKKYFG